MSKTTTYLVVGGAAVVAVGALYYFHNRSTGGAKANPSGAVAAANKSPAGQATASKGSNIFDFGGAVAQAGAGAYAAYLGSSKNSTAAVGQ